MGGRTNRGPGVVWDQGVKHFNIGVIYTVDYILFNEHSHWKMSLFGPMRHPKAAKSQKNFWASVITLHCSTNSYLWILDNIYLIITNTCTCIYAALEKYQSLIKNQLSKIFDSGNKYTLVYIRVSFVFFHGLL